MHAHCGAYACSVPQKERKSQCTICQSCNLKLPRRCQSNTQFCALCRFDTLISWLKGRSKCLIVSHSTLKCHGQPRLFAASMLISTALTHGECCWFTFEAYPVSSLQLNCKLNKIGKARQKHSKQRAGAIVRMAEDTPKWSRPASQRRPE